MYFTIFPSAHPQSFHLYSMVDACDAAAQGAYTLEWRTAYAVNLNAANDDLLVSEHAVDAEATPQPPGRIARNVNPPATPGRGGPTTPGTPGTPQTQAYLRGTPEVVIPDLLGRPVLRYRGEWVFETP